MQKKKLGNFYFLTKKMIFLAFFLLFKASVRSRPPGPPAVPGVFSPFFSLRLLLLTHFGESSMCEIIFIDFGPGGLRAPCVRHASAMRAPCVLVCVKFETFN